MEKEEVMMMMVTSPDNNPTYETISYQEPITNYPSWKLYDNPFYNSSKHHQNHYHHHHPHNHLHPCQSDKQQPEIHHLHLPISTRKIAASFWDLSFFRNIMETEMDIARAQIIELKAELDYEHKARKRAESVSKRLAKELAEERRGREAMERVCEELARVISSEKSEIDRVKREMEEERKMLRIAEVLREERVHMKLTEAKILFEEKLLELEETKRTHQEDHKVPGLLTASTFSGSLSGKFARLILSEKSIDDNNGESTSSEKLQYNDNVSNISSSIAIKRRASLSEVVENPHIKRGIKGFVEFPRVVRAIGSKSCRHWGTKLECQKAQLRILLKQKNPIRLSNNLIMS
ncbi:hypothetical protein LWI28_005506 [Acer negundo]|uniref:Branchless trichome n=1 Tax=Acer negundo TaxID=4023 RepID=A0AAD5IQ78_ACENE|nr:hypothetical protein LWI28_005506 [Acer negundo]KAK4845031.1 hypothetical protein QYF36_027462 [Acer negundo]